MPRAIKLLQMMIVALLLSGVPGYAAQTFSGAPVAVATPSPLRLAQMHGAPSIDRVPASISRMQSNIGRVRPLANPGLPPTISRNPYVGRVPASVSRELRERHQARRILQTEPPVLDGYRGDLRLQPRTKRRNRGLHRRARFLRKGVRLYDGVQKRYLVRKRATSGRARRAKQRAHLSCKRVRTQLRHRGYRRIKAYDCRGKVYGFNARKGKRRYKIRTSARKGIILSRYRLR